MHTSTHPLIILYNIYYCHIITFSLESLPSIFYYPLNRLNPFFLGLLTVGDLGATYPSTLTEDLRLVATEALKEDFFLSQVMRERPPDPDPAPTTDPFA